MSSSVNRIGRQSLHRGWQGMSASGFHSETAVSIPANRRMVDSDLEEVAPAVNSWMAE